MFLDFSFVPSGTTSLKFSCLRANQLTVLRVVSPIVPALNVDLISYRCSKIIIYVLLQLLVQPVRK